jgi:hypothetical protein
MLIGEIFQPSSYSSWMCFIPSGKFYRGFWLTSANVALASFFLLISLKKVVRFPTTYCQLPEVNEYHLKLLPNYWIAFARGISHYYAKRDNSEDLTIKTLLLLFKLFIGVSHDILRCMGNYN